MSPLSVVLLAGCLVMLLAGCGEHRRFGNDLPINFSMNHAVQPVLLSGKYGGTLSEALPSDPKTFNPWLSDDIVSGAILGLMYESLETRDPFTLQFVPRLAYLPKISHDGLTYTYTLRPHLKWSDGVSLTSDDVIFTLDMIFNTSTMGDYRETMLVPVQRSGGGIVYEPFKYTKLDDRTVQFVLPAVCAPAQEMFTFMVAPKHALENAYLAGRFNSTWGTDTSPHELVCDGPYLMSAYNPGQRVEFKRNPNFWRFSDGMHMPYLDRFTDFITPDANGQVLDFRSGETSALEVPAMQYPILDKYAVRDNYTLIGTGPAMRYEYLDFNRNPTSTMDKRLLRIFSDVRFRRACSYAIERNTLCDDILIGLAHPACSPITPAIPQFYDSNVKPYPYDPAKARQLLLTMGMKPDRTGKMLYQGKPVSFTVFTNVSDPSNVAITTVVVGDLQEIGLEAQEDPISRNSLITRLTAPPYDWEAYILGWSPGLDPNDDSCFWCSSGNEHDWWPSEPKPETTWEARIDQDFARGAREMDPALRKKYYNDWQQVVSDEQALIFIDYRDKYMAVRNCYGNVHGNVSGNVLSNVEEIFDIHCKGSAR